MGGRLAAVAMVLALLAPLARAQDLPLPQGAESTAEVIHAADTIHLPSGRFEAGRVPRLRLDGRVSSRAWRLPERGQGTLARLAPMREALEKAGWEVLFECAAEGCGGFDFRFAVPVLPAPAMFVNLFDYRYLLARRGKEHAMLFVSRAGERGYVQLTHVAPAEVGLEAPGTAPALKPAPGTGDLVDRLRAAGHVALSGLDFASGEATLGPGPHPDLAALAAFVAETPGARIALVGHTDGVGGLESNIALSQARADAVRIRLVEAHGVAPERIEARGVGYLAPVAPNSTPEGREANRRVEAVLLE